MASRPDSAHGPATRDVLLPRFAATRALSLAIAASLSDGDATVQSMPDASPAKWHLAHTSWFLETFVLRDFVTDYSPFDAEWAYLFNSYYEGEGARHPRGARGMLTRPSLDAVRAYRAHVDAAVERAIATLPDAARTLIELGCEHEAQHQELMLTDLLHLFAQNPLFPGLFAPAVRLPAALPSPIEWIAGCEGRVEIGHAGHGFAFDCEGPRHSVWLVPHALADRLVTNAEWADFVADGGYRRADLWLSDGWAWRCANDIGAPLYWREGDQFGLDGLRARERGAPVAHVSFYEADAYARWADARLPTEFEWEAAAALLDAASGNQLDRADPAHPRAATGSGLRQMFGDVWQWTASAFLPYPGFRVADGAVGEYNGKFMSGQMVLRGASCATPRGSSRATVRNFFPPTARWQFSGLRLARDL